jgi:hypothetical protein
MLEPTLFEISRHQGIVSVGQATMDSAQVVFEGCINRLCNATQMLHTAFINETTCQQ